MLGNLLLALIISATSPGFLSVQSIPPGFPVFVEGESIGKTPLERYQLSPGAYWVTIVSNDSLETLYRQVRNGSLRNRLSALWSLVYVDGATSKVEILPGCETKVTIEAKTMARNVCRAKWLFAGGIGGLFGIGVVVGLVIGLAVQ